MPNYVYITTGPLKDTDAAALSDVGVGEIKTLRNGTRAFSIRVNIGLIDHDRDQFRAAARRVCDTVKSAPPAVAEILRANEAQLCIVIEGSDHDGFPPLSFDAETIRCLSSLGATVSVDIY